MARARRTQISAAGRTTLALFDAVKKARKGETVRHPVATSQAAQLALHRLKSMGDQGLPTNVKFEDMGRRIIFPGGGILILAIAGREDPTQDSTKR